MISPFIFQRNPDLLSIELLTQQEFCFEFDNQYLCEAAQAVFLRVFFSGQKKTRRKKNKLYGKASFYRTHRKGKNKIVMKKKEWN